MAASDCFLVRQQEPEIPLRTLFGLKSEMQFQKWYLTHIRDKHLYVVHDDFAMELCSINHLSLAQIDRLFQYILVYMFYSCSK